MNDKDYIRLDGRLAVSASDSDASLIRVKLNGKWMHCVTAAVAGDNGSVWYSTTERDVIIEHYADGKVEIYRRKAEHPPLRNYQAEEAWMLYGLERAKAVLNEFSARYQHRAITDIKVLASGHIRLEWERMEECEEHEHASHGTEIHNYNPEEHR